MYSSISLSYRVSQIEGDPPVHEFVRASPTWDLDGSKGRFDHVLVQLEGTMDDEFPMDGKVGYAQLLLPFEVNILKHTDNAMKRKQLAFIKWYDEIYLFNTLKSFIHNKK